MTPEFVYEISFGLGINMSENFNYGLEKWFILLDNKTNIYTIV